ncbi:hypothetical protein AC579_10383 [Pseudocercospora musae]|uniref:Uncharacterized protein n=1 Tax=Pseudocercospora musae TaxID=113226 RepID=A0A139IC45_9PEZI|nr:hypothetical protein AC579_10383 [Pseudocercospora musae]
MIIFYTHNIPPSEVRNKSALGLSLVTMLLVDNQMDHSALCSRDNIAWVDPMRGTTPGLFETCGHSPNTEEDQVEQYLRAALY